MVGGSHAGALIPAPDRADLDHTPLVAMFALLLACNVDSTLTMVVTGHEAEGDVGDAAGNVDEPTADSAGADADGDDEDGDADDEDLTDSAEPEPTPEPGACPNFEAPAVVGHLPPGLDEVSGLVASRAHPGVLWALEDSGNAAELYALDIDGALLATIRLPVANVDWEDLALAPCGAGDCLWIADVGDNDLVRDNTALYMLPEPEVRNGTADVDTIAVRYGDGHHNVEAMVIDASGAATLFSKRDDGVTEIIREDGGRFRAVATLAASTAGDDARASRVTAADLWPDERTLLLRTYGHAWRYDLDENGLASLLDADRTELTATYQDQVEAVAWDPSIGGWWQTSEGEGADVVFTACAP
ncbi:hypothetical protein LBMAG42_39070 [Deltaproteobacteria bacterium]|nr:hypothetical protein LBMAG42_39070 [Deltaproteobacteria bacterium]